MSVGGVVWTAAQAQNRPSDRASPRDRGQPVKLTDAALTAQLGLIPRGKVTFTAEREAAALTFARQNRPELLDVLEDLKTRQATEYQRAICDLFWTSEMLAAVRQQDQQRYECALRTWQLEALANLLAARLAGAPADADRVKAELAQTVAQLVDAQLEESAYAVRRQEAQWKRAQDRQKRLEGQRDELVRERVGAMLKAIESSEPLPASDP
ncbi:MAG: hypothetical protein HYS13_14100 [Planctomycetia bacterium]|nr:hypothetical protein [Planctomycetia bacterium]